MHKKILLAALGTLMAASLHSQNLLSYEWRFITGDDPGYAAPGYDDSEWKTLQAGIAWENQGYDTYDGFAWYRQTFHVPGFLKEEAEEMGGFMLYLGRIDDSDETFLNGKLLSVTGGMPPEYLSGYGEKRAYRIPPDRILWDRENTIAVRVYDGGGGGGIIEEPIGLSVIGTRELVSIKPVMEREDHLVLERGPVELSLLVENNLKVRLEGEIILSVRSDFGEPLMEKTASISLKRGGSKKIPVELGEMEPGFYRISALLKSENDNSRNEFAIGVRPEEVVSPLDRPDDFEDYWRRARRELDAVEPQFRLIRQDELCTEAREVFLLEMRSLGNILVRGWYMRPVREGKYPAILHVQGYSSNMTPDNLYPGDDMVSLALNIRGHGNSRDHVDPGFPGYLLYHLEDRELYIYRGAYMDCIRAVDFLYSRDEVDTSRVAVEGGSQGGALSFAAAALDNARIDLCVPHVPFLSDFRDYFRVAGWPGGEFFNYFREHPGIPEDTVYKTLSYIDIKNLAPWVRAPVLMSVGLMDDTCPPHINFAAYNQLNVPRSYVAYPYSGHALPSSYHALKYDYIRKQFGME